MDVTPPINVASYVPVRMVTGEFGTLMAEEPNCILDLSDTVISVYH